MAENLLLKLINEDKSKFDKPTVEVELPRISDILGGKFIVTIKMLPTRTADAIEDKCTKKTKEGVELDGVKFVNEILVNSVEYEGSCLFFNMDLQKSFDVKTPYDLLDKLLLAKEKEALFSAYKNMATLDGKELVKKIKK